MSNLPKYHPSHQQEADSLARLAAVLSSSQFILRKEDGGDFGVDRVLEAVENGEATNVRSHIQVKSSTRSKKTKNRAIAKKVPVKTLTYLLRTVNSLFLVYSLAENLFYWAWVRDIALAAARQGLDLEETKQKEFTYHFTEVLDPAALDTIHAKLLRDNAFLRKIDLDRCPLLRAVIGDSLPEPATELVLLYLEERFEAVTGLASATDLERPIMRVLVAHSYYQLRKFPEALQVITQGNRASPVDDQGRRVLAMILCEMGNDHGERETLQRALETQESIPRDRWDWTDHYNFGNMLDLLGRHREALAEYDAATRRQPDVAIIWKNMAGAYFRLGEHERELECLDRALELDPDLVEALVSKAISLGNRVGDLEEAIALLRKAIHLSTKPHYDNTDSYWWLGRFLANAGQVAEALQVLDEGLNSFPVSLRLRQLRASIVVEKWRHSDRIADEAVMLLEDIISRDPKNFPARAELIEIYSNRDQPEQTKLLIVDTLQEVGFSCAEEVLGHLDLGELLPLTRQLDSYFRYRSSSESLAIRFFECFELRTATYEKIELEFAIRYTELATIIRPDRLMGELLPEIEDWIARFRKINRNCSRLITQELADADLDEQADLVARIVTQLPELTLRELSRQLGWLLYQSGYTAEARDTILEIEHLGSWLKESLEPSLEGAHDVIRWTETRRSGSSSS